MLFEELELLSLLHFLLRLSANNCHLNGHQMLLHSLLLIPLCKQLPPIVFDAEMMMNVTSSSSANSMSDESNVVMFNF